VAPGDDEGIEVTMRQHGVRTIAIWVALVVAAGVLIASPWAGAAQPPDFDALLRDDPYLTLFTESNDASQMRTINQLSGAALDARLDDLTRWYAHFHSEGSNNWPFGDPSKGTSSTTLASKLAAHGAVVTNYRNGSYVSQANRGQANWGEAEMLERQAPLAIATFFPGNSKPYVAGNDGAAGGRLLQAIDATETTVRVSATPSGDRPAGTPATWPFMASRGAGAAPNAHSTNTHDVTTWLRVDDELLQIVGPPTVSGGDTITLDVVRGLWGTNPRQHGANTRVQSPVYIGSSSAAATDAGLAGAPNRNDANATLRYAIKIWKAQGNGFIADRIAATFGPNLQGYNGVWLDVSSCNQYNNSDAEGNPVFQWNDDTGTKWTRDGWGGAQKTKLAGLRNRFPGVWFAGNNLGNNDSCTWDLLATAYDGAALEHYMKPGGEFNFNWATQMDQTFRIMTGNWPGIFWVRWNFAYTGNVAQYQRLAYGAVLLAYRPTATRFQFGGPFGLQAPNDLFLWNLGAPTSNPANLAATAVGSTGLYRRDFRNAIVVVNPTGSPITYGLDGTYWDVNAANAQGQPTAVTSVRVGANDAAFLLRAADDALQPSPSPSPSPTSPSPTPPPSPVNVAPDAQIGAPIPGAVHPAGSVSLQGVATDDAGVASVELAIRDTSTNRWWNASTGTWVQGRTGSPATLTQPGAVSTSWSGAWPAPGGGSYQLVATARDAAGTTDQSPATVSFTVAGSSPTPTTSPTPTASATPTSSPTVGPTVTASPTAPPSPTTTSPTPGPGSPDTFVSNPTFGTEVNAGTRVVVEGSATDPVSVRRVGVAIRDLDTRKWWHPNGCWGWWRELRADLSAGNRASTGWRYTWTAPRAGRFLFVVRAVGADGRIDGTPAGAIVVARTRVDRRAPSTTIVRTRASGRAGPLQALVIKGFARDERSLAQVRVRIKDPGTHRFWHRGGRWSAARFVYEVRPRADGAWGLRVAVPDGRVRVRARAVDRAGNRDPSPAIRVVRIGLRQA
jgi:hypothetical protein